MDDKLQSPEAPPFPEKTVIGAPLFVTMALSFALISFAVHLSSPRSLVFCACYTLITTWLMFRMGQTIRRQIIPRLRFRLDPPARRSALMLSALLAYAVLINLVDRYALAGFYQVNGWLSAETVERFLDATLLVRVSSLLSVFGYFSAQLSYRRMTTSLIAQGEALKLAAEARRKQQEAEVEAHTAKQLAAEAELTALKMQINPHFLFNTLASIAVLARIDGSRAGQMTDKLAEIFRYALQASKRPSATLGEELEFLKAYFEIERARFGARLEMSIDVPRELMTLEVPNLLLQPMVENAVAHAFQATCSGWRINVSAVSRDGFAEISVTDNGVGFQGCDPAKIIGGGTALKNIDERLRRLHGPACSLIAEENSPQGAAFRVRIPLSVAIQA